VIHAGNQKITNKEQSPRVGELRQELRRKIAAHTQKAGAHATAILSLTLYHRTAPSPCYPAMCEPGSDELRARSIASRTRCVSIALIPAKIIFSPLMENRGRLSF
jgi:hypothetical protein